MKRFLLILSAVTLILACDTGTGSKSSSSDETVSESSYINPADFPDLEVENLSDGGSTSERTQTIKTQVPNPGDSAGGTGRAGAASFDGTVKVYVNEAYALANPVYDSTNGVWTIETYISLTSGENTIYVAVLNESGSIYSESPRISITGTFAAYPHRVQLYWDNYGDVDLHVVYNDTWDDTNHCYYANKSIYSSSVMLDYDNTDALGPENMTLLDNAPSGTYYVYVKYFFADVTEDITATINIFEDGTLVSTDTHIFSEDDDINDDESYNAATDWYVGTIVK